MSSAPTSPASNVDESRQMTTNPSSPPSDRGDSSQSPSRKAMDEEEQFYKDQEAEEERERDERRAAAASATKKQIQKDQKSTYDLLDRMLIASEAFTQHLEKQGIDSVKDGYMQPKLMTGGKLRGYQLEGFRWLVNIYNNGINGILADEMGLGKTLQTIALITFLKQINVKGPFLIVAPLSTLSNWIQEFEKWTPKIKALQYHGSKPERDEIIRKQLSNFKGAASPDFPVICTSFEIAMRDRKELSNNGMQWTYLMIDEGHRLKNYNCKLLKELMRYNTESKLLITGTPLQNNLAELWSLMHFLQPETFYDLDSFQSWFAASELQNRTTKKEVINSERETKIIEKLQAVLRPYVLRRVKTDVESDLPRKREYILFAKLTKPQLDIYNAIDDGTIREHLESEVLSTFEARSGASTPRSLKRKAGSGVQTPNKSSKSSRASTPGEGVALATRLRGNKSKKSYREVEEGEGLYQKDEDKADKDVLDAPDPAEDGLKKALKDAKRIISGKKLQNPAMQHRLACNSPHLFYPLLNPDSPDESLIASSGKLQLLDKLVAALLAAGHKLLIFSQFKAMLDLLEDWAVSLRKYNICRLDGSTAQVDRAEEIRRFNAKGKNGADIFLLSTRAGGQGINLMAADTVILFDSDFNPQQDLQAQDRAHRIGQTRPVIVYRLATRGTVEEELLEKAAGKRLLEKLVMRSAKFRADGRRSKDGEDLAEFRRIVREMGLEKGRHKEVGEVLSKRDLEILMDRSVEAYDRAEKGEAETGDAFEVYETKGTEGGKGALSDLSKGM
ncbi:MAG: hypothetical protein M1814_002770 [Vezdaea aestivalis]|nr:MAG: hypothetical protein M1814_002770 [Vezdaea aestivalis]